MRVKIETDRALVVSPTLLIKTKKYHTFIWRKNGLRVHRVEIAL